MTRSIDQQSLFEHADFIRALAARVASDSHEEEDLVQQTWVIALVQPPGRLQRWRGWLSAVVRNCARRGWRTRQRRGRREALAARSELLPSAVEIAARSELQRRIAQAVDDLPEPYRSTVWLRYFEELSTADIAKREGITESSVRSRLCRALEYLKTRLESLDPADARLLIALARPPIGSCPSTTGSGVPLLSLSSAAKITAGVLVTLLPLAWWGYSALRGSEGTVRSQEVARSSLLEPPRVGPQLPQLPPEPSGPRVPYMGGGDGGAPEDPPRDPAPKIVRHVPLPSGSEEAGSAPPTWYPNESEDVPQDEEALPSSVDRKLMTLIQRYYEALDEGNYGGMASLRKKIDEVLAKAADRLRLEGEGADAVLRHPKLLVQPLNDFPDYPSSWKRGRFEEHEVPGGPSFWLSVPRSYSNRGDPWPLLVVLRGPEHGDPQLWLDELTEKHPRVVEQSIVLIPSLPEEPSPDYWSSDEGTVRALQPIGFLTWDQLRIDQDRILVYATGAAASSATELAARFSDRFAGLALEVDIEPRPWVVNLEHLAILAPPGRLTDALAELEVERVAHRSPAGEPGISGRTRVEQWLEAARRVRFPKRVRGVFPSLGWGDRTWLKVRQLGAFSPDGPLPNVEAWLDRERNAVHIESSGIDRIFLRLSDEVLDLDRPIQVFVGRRLEVKRDLETLLDTAFYTGERSRLFTHIAEVDLE